MFYSVVMTKLTSKDHRKGRAAAYNPALRYNRQRLEAFDDGWEQEPLALLRTEVSFETPRRVISRNRSPDVPFDRSVNPYRGCEHGCIYCYARPSHAYLDLSPGLDFETRLVARPDAPQVLERELGKKGYRAAPIALGSNTDPYQPIEKRHEITRNLLRVLSDHNHPVIIITKGTLIERDLDILAPMAARGLAAVGVSVTTLDPKLSRVMEPRVPHPARRLQTIERLTNAGVPVRAMVSPVIPALTDHEFEPIIAACAAAGARAASYITLRLPLEVAPLFETWLAEHFPDRANRVLSRLKELNGGKTYDSAFDHRMKGQGKWAELIAQRFKIACRRNGLHNDHPPLRRDLFAVPPKKGDQLSLF